MRLSSFGRGEQTRSRKKMWPESWRSPTAGCKPRSPQQILSDLEADRDGGDDSRQFYMLDEVTKAAVRAGAFDKTAEYGNELLSEAAKNGDDVNYGNAIHDGNLALGRVALREGDVTKAGKPLLEAGRTPGSTQLNSFGPDMTQAQELLEKGEREVVLQYFALCRFGPAAGSNSMPGARRYAPAEFRDLGRIGGSAGRCAPN